MKISHSLITCYFDWIPYTWDTVHYTIYSYLINFITNILGVSEHTWFTKFNRYHASSWPVCLSYSMKFLILPHEYQKIQKIHHLKHGSGAAYMYVNAYTIYDIISFGFIITNTVLCVCNESKQR